MLPRLLEKYRNEVVPQMQKQFGIDNIMAVPRIEKVIINMGVGEAIEDAKIMDKAVHDLTTITGQKPVLRKAKIAISNFKLRAGLAVGCKVTLRKVRMYEFLDRLLNFTLPRIRDFNGVSRKSFDKQGNYSMGLADQLIFPEIEFDRDHRSQGMDITIVFNQDNTDQNMELLRLLGMPFSKQGENR